MIILLHLSVESKKWYIKGESYLQVKTKGGTIKIVDNKIIISNADEATVYLTAGTNYKNYKDVLEIPLPLCTTALQNIASKTYQTDQGCAYKRISEIFQYVIN